MQPRLVSLFIISFFICAAQLPAQTFVPLPVTGFNHDVIAEGGPNSLVTTTIPLDGPATSNMIIYTEAFRNFAGFSGGGIPDNGTITDASGTYQLGTYTGNNCLLLPRTQSGSLNLITPGQYSKLRILSFAAEGASVINATVFFTDGSSSQYISNYTLADWFFGTANIVISGYGRCRRVAGPPYGEEAFPVNPRMYFIEIPLSCADQLKNVQRVSFDNISPSSTGSIFPNAVFFGISGIPFSQIITDVITPCDCAGPNGSIALNVTGSSGPYSFFWNTTPQQIGATATGLAPGNYTCTIADANGCTTSYNGAVPLNNNQTILAIANPTTICPGGYSQLTTTVLTGGTLTNYVWNPGNFPGASVNVFPTSTTTYTVSASNWLGCSASAQVTVTVSAPASPVINNISVCSGSTATLQVQNPVAGETYNWYTSPTGGVSIATGISYTVNNVTVNATYYVEAIATGGCSSATRSAATVTVNANAVLPLANNVTVCPGNNAALQIQNPQIGVTYNWYSASSGGAPLATGTSYTLNNVTASTTIYIDAMNVSSCVSVGRLPVTVSLFQQLAQPVVTVSNLNFSSVTFSWIAVAGATAYQVSTDGGITFQSPSSGATGTTHTISGLNSNETVSIQVRALGQQVCETSQWSVRISGTTLSSKEIFVPNVFTPNGDNRNDILYVYGNYIASIQFNVFNQWGEMIFSSADMAKGWDGTYKGKQQPVGVYVYTLKVILQDGKEVIKKGSISLIR